MRPGEDIATGEPGSAGAELPAMAATLAQSVMCYGHSACTATPIGSAQAAGPAGLEAGATAID